MRKIITLALLLALLPHVAGADQFHRVKMIVNTGEKGEEQDVILRFDPAMADLRRIGVDLAQRGFAALLLLACETIRTWDSGRRGHLSWLALRFGERREGQH